MGTLNNGGTGSPSQFMLDMEIRKSQFALSEGISVDEEGLPFAEICKAVREDRDFLSDEHTARHCRELWTSRLFLTENPALGSWSGDEESILGACEELWRDNIKNCQPPEWPAEKLRALENVLASAKKEFSVA
jgi:trimethylamine:corrinoid methyltransferase-like protein